MHFSNIINIEFLINYLICFFRWIHDYQDACVDKLERFMRGEMNVRADGPIGRHLGMGGSGTPGTPGSLSKSLPPHNSYHRSNSNDSDSNSRWDHWIVFNCDFSHLLSTSLWCRYQRRTLLMTLVTEVQERTCKVSWVTMKHLLNIDQNVVKAML